MTSPHIVLVGLMGSGKSSVGRRLAEVLDRPFVDSDDEIEASERRTIAQIFADDGEDFFRDVEARVVADLLGARPASVIATGGGVVLRAENRDRLIDHCVVWLRADVETLCRRVERNPHERPLLGDDPLGRLTRLASDRGALYAEIADITIDVDTRSLGEVVTLIADSIAPTTGARS